MITFRAGYSAYNWIDQPNVVIEADSESLSAPASNLATYEAGVPWTAINLSLQGGAATATFKLGADRLIECLGFVLPERADDAGAVDFTPTIAAGDGVRWRISSSENPITVGDVFDSDVDLPGPLTTAIDPTLGVHGFLTPTAFTAPRVDLTVTLAATPAAPFDLFHIGRAWVGPFSQFLVNWRAGTKEWAWVEDDLGHMVRRWQAEFGWVRDSELAEIGKIQQQLNTKKQIFWWPSSTDPAEAFIARFKDSGSFRRRYNNATLWTPTLQEDWLGV